MAYLEASAVGELMVVASVAGVALACERGAQYAVYVRPDYANRCIHVLHGIFARHVVPVAIPAKPDK